MNHLTFDEIYTAYNVIDTRNVLKKLQMKEAGAEGRQREREREAGGEKLIRNSFVSPASIGTN